MTIVVLTESIKIRIIFLNKLPNDLSSVRDCVSCVCDLWYISIIQGVSKGDEMEMGFCGLLGVDVLEVLNL